MRCFINCWANHGLNFHNMMITVLFMLLIVSKAMKKCTGIEKVLIIIDKHWKQVFINKHSLFSCFLLVFFFVASLFIQSIWCLWCTFKIVRHRHERSLLFFNLTQCITHKRKKRAMSVQVPIIIMKNIYRRYLTDTGKQQKQP